MGNDSTNLDKAPRVNGKQIDLWKLFYVIRDRGGYDHVSAQKLEWRRVGHEFGLGPTNGAAYAFSLKSVFYKYLAAYAIKRIYKQEPPPKDILEGISAKGADLLTRTRETFVPPKGREVLANGNDSDPSEDDAHRTPDKMDGDEHGSGRAMRGLRQDPSRRVLFQPPVTSSRFSRHSSNHAPSPQPSTIAASNTYYMNPASNPNSSSFSIQNYEPRPPMPLTLRPLLTPSSNPLVFKERVRKIREAQLAKLIRDAPAPTNNSKGMMLPGTGFEGPNIYVRTLLSLRSRIPSEQDYALHHLVKISHERGDKFKFEAFPGLAEGLIEKMLQVSSLFYDVQWHVSYALDGSADHDVNVLEGMYGTPDLLDRIHRLPKKDVSNEIQTREFCHAISKLNEACLVTRNMSMLEENARYLADQASLKDFLTIALNLPKLDCLIEMKHYVLEMTENFTKYWSLAASDPLYTSLLNVLEDGSDRGAALTSLRAISRISLTLEESNRLANVSVSILNTLFRWTLLDDEELVSSCLDFFYQYTAVADNVALLLAESLAGRFDLDALLAHLGRLLLYNALPSLSKRLVTSATPPPDQAIAKLPADLLEPIRETAEPERSSVWLRACFEEHPGSSITQIMLWQAYQLQFTRHATPSAPLLAAAEFIKNVSSTFPSANAQVVSGPVPKFIIKGIRPRQVPVDQNGHLYLRCLWRGPDARLCNEFHSTPATTWAHLLTDHLQILQNEDGSWNLQPPDDEPRKLNCHWAGCQHFGPIGGTYSRFNIGMHVKVHLSDHSSLATHRSKYNRSAPNKADASEVGHGAVDRIPDDQNLGGPKPTHDYFLWLNTAVDERGEAAGLPLTSILILRNLARNIPKAMTTIPPAATDKPWTMSIGQVMESKFGPLIPNLHHVMAHNRSLPPYVSDLLHMVEKGMDWKHGD